MTYNAKAITIQIILIISTVIIAFNLGQLFEAKGLQNLTYLCTFIPTTAFGLYILFGKYVYLKGPVTKPVRIIFGLFFLLLMPIIWLICS